MTDRRTRVVSALAVLVLLIAACAPGPGAGGTLEGTKWVLDSLGDDGALTIAPETVYADAEFTAHRVSGFSGCNEFNGLRFSHLGRHSRDDRRGIHKLVNGCISKIL